MHAISLCPTNSVKGLMWLYSFYKWYSQGPREGNWQYSYCCCYSQEGLCCSSLPPGEEWEGGPLCGELGDEAASKPGDWWWICSELLFQKLWLAITEFDFLISFYITEVSLTSIVKCQVLCGAEDIVVTKMGMGLCLQGMYSLLERGRQNPC